MMKDLRPVNDLGQDRTPRGSLGHQCIYLLRVRLGRLLGLEQTAGQGNERLTGQKTRSLII